MFISSCNLHQIYFKREQFERAWHCMLFLDSCSNWLRIIVGWLKIGRKQTDFWTQYKFCVCDQTTNKTRGCILNSIEYHSLLLHLLPVKLHFSLFTLFCCPSQPTSYSLWFAFYKPCQLPHIYDLGTRMAQWLTLLPPGLDLGSFCAEFICTLCVCLGFHQVLQFLLCKTCMFRFCFQA